MKNSRRSFLTEVVPASALAGFAWLTADARQSKPPHPLVPGSQSQSQVEKPQAPAPFPDAPKLTDKEKKAILTEDQKQIRKDVDRLFGLAQDLKSQAEKMDSTQVLSLQFVQKTEEIEKLARKIRGLARG